MSKLEDIVEDVLSRVQGITGSVEALGSLLTAITATATSIQLTGAAYNGRSSFTTGTMEIGLEVVYIQTIDAATNTATGVLRGQKGTAAVAHAAGTSVRMNPVYSRFEIAKRINETITNIYPNLFGVKTVEYTSNGYDNIYSLPVETMQVLSVKSKTYNGAWVEVKSWDFENTIGVNNTKALQVYKGYETYNPIQVTYKTQGKAITFGQDFTASTLPDWAEELITLGALDKLVAYIEIARFAQGQQIQNPEQQFGQGLNNSKYFHALYQEKLAEAKKNLRNQYPLQIHNNPIYRGINY